MKLPILLAATVGTGLAAVLHQVPLKLSDPALAAGTQTVTIHFQAKVGDRPFQCGESYALGTTATPVKPTDFRFYVSDVALIDSSGNAVPVRLEQDQKWQYQSVALLDFEDKSGACANGTSETRNQVIGTVPPGDYQHIRFTLGVPFELNHADATLAPSPLNLTSLWWNWRGGYKFIRIDLATAAMHGAKSNQLIAKGESSSHSDHPHHPASDQIQGFAIHLGSTACQADANVQQPTSCDNPNRAEISLPFNPTQDVITADLAALVASTNLAVNQPDTPAGCMASPEDLDCMGIMHNVGLPFDGQPSDGQTFFRVEQ